MCKQPHPLLLGLRYQHPVERILVMLRKLARRQRMRNSNGQEFKPAGGETLPTRDGAFQVVAALTRARVDSLAIVCGRLSAKVDRC